MRCGSDFGSSPSADETCGKSSKLRRRCTPTKNSRCDRQCGSAQQANHLIAGLYEAAHDHAPVLAISGDVPNAKGGIDYLQWADHVQAFRDACVYSASIVSADAAPAQIHEAIATAYGERGVAHV